MERIRVLSHSVCVCVFSLLLTAMSMLFSFFFFYDSWSLILQTITWTVVELENVAETI